MPTYALLLRLDAPINIQVGALGKRVFPAGWYVYTGSAKRGLRARVARHMRREKRLRWHIDYLTLVAQPAGAWCDENPADLECEWAARLIAASGAPLPVAGFGASDCGCPGHLAYFRRRPDVGRLLAAAVTGEITVISGSTV